MTDEEWLQHFSSLEGEFKNLATLTDRPQYLAHYTSIDVLEKIIAHDELWLSHPFFMNDMQEMRFGIVEGFKLFSDFAQTPAFLTACGTPARVQLMVTLFGSYFAAFDLKHAVNVFVLCLSAHDDPGDDDGLLSMWRAYGGQGNGAALVFSTEFIRPREGSPLFAGKVFYGSDQERRTKILDIIQKGADIIQAAAFPDDKLQIAAYALFEAIKIFALLSKHKGFSEEKEWRIIYLPDRDHNNLLTKSISHFIGKRGIEPKLKLKIQPLHFATPEGWTFDSILHQIILGPSLSQPVIGSAVCRMFEAHQKPQFIGRTRHSSIPLRPTL